jgi:TRAP-type C4-dicarboxylate transport system permease small subunit
MRKLNSLAVSASNVLEKVTAIPLIIIGGLMFGVVLVGTFWRYVLNDPILWTEEAARYLMIWMALIAASISMKRREHVSMNLLINPLPAVIKRIVGTLTSLAVAFFLLVLTREGITMVLSARSQISPALGISMFWPLLSVPLSGILMLAQLFLVLVIDWTGGPRSEGMEAQL